MAVSELRAPAAAAVAPPLDEAERVRSAVEHDPLTVGNLAFLGDEWFPFSDLGEGFLMHGVGGSIWLAMSDPVGVDEKVTVDLIPRCKELADRNGGQAAFYRCAVRPRRSISTPAFPCPPPSSARRGSSTSRRSRWTGRRGRSSGQVPCRAERSRVQDHRCRRGRGADAQLKATSDAWLARQRGREKRFSLGFWSDRHPKGFDHAVVTLDAEPVAFANIRQSAGRNDRSIDPMRHVPNDAMDDLFIPLFAAAKADGVRGFSLGMAPLSGLPHHRLASAWTRFGSIIYRR